MKFVFFITLSLMTCSSSFGATAAAPRGSSGGRFQVVQISDMRRDQILIDTQTGKMWHSVCLASRKDSQMGDCSYSAWMADDIEGITKSQSAIYKDASEIKKMIEQEESK